MGLMWDRVRVVAAWVGLRGALLVIAPVISLSLAWARWNDPYTLCYRSGAVALWMALWWMTETVPLAVTALLPLVLMPTLGVLTSAELAPVYLNDTVMAMLGTFIIAAAMEKWQLHRRLAIRLLLLLGGRPWGVLLGFMLSTFALSMWLSNTATVMVMVPLIEAVMHRLRAALHLVEGELTAGATPRNDDDRSAAAAAAAALSPAAADGARSSAAADAPAAAPRAADAADASDVPLRALSEDRLLPDRAASTTDAGADADADARSRGEALAAPAGADPEAGAGHGPLAAQLDAFHAGVLLAVSYCSALGGISTPVGTGPNLVLLQLLRVLFPAAPGISFAAWMGFAMPTALLFFAAMFGFFVWRRCPRALPVSMDALRAEYATLGAMTLAEVLVLLDLLLLVLLWMLRSFALLPPYVGDGTVSIAAALVLFVLPAHRPHLPCWPCHAFCSRAWHPKDALPLSHSRHRSHSHSHSHGGGRRGHGPILEWADSRHVGWGVLLILGGGFALAAGMRKAGLTAAIALLLGGLRDVPAVVLVLIVVAVLCFLTELMSNVAVANLLLPVLGATAVAAGQNPLLLMTPATIACSFAFMLPAATPPNAIITASGHVRTADMARVGLLANLVGIVLLTGGTLLLGPPTLGIELGVLPPWASP